MKATWWPLGDQSPQSASSTIRDGSPPSKGTRNRERLVTIERVNRSVLPSGENLGKSSGPLVTGDSRPVAISLTQIRFIPSRSELKQTRLPSAEAAGE